MTSLTASVVIPCRNESAYVVPLLDALRKQDFAEAFEVIVADGFSTDGCWEQLCTYQLAVPMPYELRLLRNPRIGTAHALNLMVAAAKGEFIVRLDAHAAVGMNYLDQIIRALRTPGLDVVGPAVKYRPSKQTTEAQVIAAILNSPFGNGGTPSRNDLESSRRPVKHAVMSCYRRTIWEDVGGYDEGLKSNEDFDFDYRASRAGFGVHALPLPTYYAYAKPDLAGLARQRWRYGLAKSQVLVKLPRSLHLRQAAPISLLPVSIVLAATWHEALLLCAIAYCVLAMATVVRSGLLTSRYGLRLWMSASILGIITAATIHYVWSGAVWWGLVTSPIMLGRSAAGAGRSGQ